MITVVDNRGGSRCSAMSDDGRARGCTQVLVGNDRELETGTDTNTKKTIQMQTLGYARRCVGSGAGAGTGGPRALGCLQSNGTVGVARCACTVVTGKL